MYQKLSDRTEAFLEEHRTSSTTLSTKNYINLATCIVSVLFTYLIGVIGVGGLPNNSELSQKYQTIVTPAGWAFSIWSLIFISQGIFALAQLLPIFRSKSVVEDGVSYWYCGLSVAQMAWTLSFAFEALKTSVVFMLSILVLLIALLISQEKAELEETITEFWLFRFPFQILTGWIVAATALNINVVFVDLSASAGIQLMLGIISLATLHAVALSLSFFVENHHYVIPSVLAWATIAIYAELSSPIEKIQDAFSDDAIDGVKLAALAVSVIILLQIGLRISFTCYRKYSREI